MVRIYSSKSLFKGKVIGGSSYFHQSALHIIDSQYRDLIAKATILNVNSCKWNVVKFDNQDRNRLSLLEYQCFNDNEFPCLEKSYQVNLKELTFKSRKHSKTNPPVLHRKELLIDPACLDYQKFESITKTLEKFGAFKNISKLGTKLRWEDELDRLGIVVKDHKAELVGNKSDAS